MPTWAPASPIDIRAAQHAYGNRAVQRWLAGRTHTLGLAPHVDATHVVQRVRKESKAWAAGAQVLGHLRGYVSQHISDIPGRSSPQVTGGYPHFEDELAQQAAHASLWGATPSAYEKTNVGAIAVMENRHGDEFLGFAYNNPAKQQREMMTKTLGLLPDDISEGAELVQCAERSGVTEHAEMVLAGSGRLPFGNYIGISQKCCLCCAAALLIQGKYRFGGSHFTAFNNWKIPGFIRNDATALKAFLGPEGWKFYDTLKAGTSYLPHAMQDELTHKDDFLSWLETAWSTLSTG